MWLSLPQGQRVGFCVHLWAFGVMRFGDEDTLGVESYDSAVIITCANWKHCCGGGRCDEGGGGHGGVVECSVRGLEWEWKHTSRKRLMLERWVDDE